LSQKEKIHNIVAGILQGSVYLSYFYLLYYYKNDSILIVVFYNMFGLFFVIFDNFNKN